MLRQWLVLHGNRFASAPAIGGLALLEFRDELAEITLASVDARVGTLDT